MNLQPAPQKRFIALLNAVAEPTKQEQGSPKLKRATGRPKLPKNRILKLQKLKISSVSNRLASYTESAEGLSTG